MKRFIGYIAAIGLLAIVVGCGGSDAGTLAYIANSKGTDFTVYKVNGNGILSTSSISPQTMPAAPQMVVFTPNRKWAYILNADGDTVYGYKRSGNGELTTAIGTYPLSGSGSTAMAVSTNSLYLYVAEPSVHLLRAYQIDTSTGQLTKVALSTGSTTTDLDTTLAVSQLIASPNGTILYGLAKKTSSASAAIYGWTMNASTGTLTGKSSTASVADPTCMALTATGTFMYIPDGTTSTTGANIYIATTSTAAPYLSVQATPKTETYFYNDTTKYPSNPVWATTTSDSLHLYVINQGSGSSDASISAFTIKSTTDGSLEEVIGTTTTTNGVTTSTASPYYCSTTDGCSSPVYAVTGNSNNSLYVLDQSSNKVFEYAINVSTGQIRSLSPAYVSTGSTPTWITIEE